MLFYRAALRLSRPTLNYAAGLIRRHRKRIRSRGRLLNPAQQALLLRVYLRKGDTFAELAAGFGISTSTAWRYANETIELLAARSPKLEAALRSAKRAGHAYVVATTSRTARISPPSTVASQWPRTMPRTPSTGSTSWPKP